MKIGIIGMGVVGKTLYKAFKKLKHNCLGIDLKNKYQILKLIDCEIIYVCLPTNQLKKKLDTGEIEKYLKMFDKVKFKGIIAIKSTLNPGDTEKFSRKYKMLKNNICFVPEFLRERCALKDFTKNHDLLLIGTNKKKNIKKIIKSHGSYPQKISIVKPTEAELIKMFSNAYNATRIVFANSFFEVCKKLKIDYSNILKEYLKRSMSTGKYLECDDNLRGFGGKCLPKDLAALDFVAQKRSSKIKFFKDVIKQNNNFKVTIKK